MTTYLENFKHGGHAVGYFTCIVNPRQIDGGAKCLVDIDNTELVDIYFDENDSETMYCKPLVDNTKKGFIVMTSEKLHIPTLENKTDFWNGKGAMANLYVQESGTTFKTTNYQCDTEVKRGMYAQWNVGNGTTCPNANGYYKVTKTEPVSGENVFIVSDVTEDETEELLGLSAIELFVR